MNTIIPIHSFVDLITNSSTEIFTTATDGTLSLTKDLVNQFLKLQGSNLKWSDLFTIELKIKVQVERRKPPYSCKECLLTQEEYDNRKSDDSDEYIYVKGAEDDNLQKVIVVTPIDPNNKIAVKIAEILENLPFSAESKEYNC